MAGMRQEKQMYFKVMDDHFPERMTITFGSQKKGQRLLYKKVSWCLPEGDRILEKGLRYGENPGQEAALYQLVKGNLQLGDCKFIEPNNGLVSAITEEDMIQAGKHPGKTNLTDVDNALNIIRYLDPSVPAVAIMKHNNPCGFSLGHGNNPELTAAMGSGICEAYNKAYNADRIAAFGGAAVFNQPVDKQTADLIFENNHYLEVICAPDYEKDAVEKLKARKNLRIIRLDNIDGLKEYDTKVVVDFKSLMDGGLIVQQSLVNRIRSFDDLRQATHEYKGTLYKVENWPPTENQIKDMIFGWAVECGVSSNSVLFVRDGTTKGIGTGQQDRLDVTIMAIDKAYRKKRDLVCFSDYGISSPSLELMIFHKEMQVSGEYDTAAEGRFAQRSLKSLLGIKRYIDHVVNRDNAGLIGATDISDAFFPSRDAVDAALRKGIRSFIQPGGSDKDYASIRACNEVGATMAFTGQRVFKH